MNSAIATVIKMFRWMEKGGKTKGDGQNLRN